MSHNPVFSPVAGTLKIVKLTYKRVPASRVPFNTRFIPYVNEPDMEELRNSLREIIRKIPETRGVLLISCIRGSKNSRPIIKVIKSDENIRERFLSKDNGNPFNWVFELLYIVGYREIHFQLASED